ncbi:hypothetical protein PBY51_003034 [Eleginops maclovinus]|nr:hypothetical protein PBY51_003034 [Eleginops maclovinus]
MLDAAKGGGVMGREGGSKGGRELQAGIKGGAVKEVKGSRRDDLTTCYNRISLFFRVGPKPREVISGRTWSPHQAMPNATGHSHRDQQVR